MKKKNCRSVGRRRSRGLGICPLSSSLFVPTPGHLDSSCVPTPGNFVIFSKKMLMPGGWLWRGGGGAWALLELTDALRYVIYIAATPFVVVLHCLHWCFSWTALLSANQTRVISYVYYYTSSNDDFLRWLKIVSSTFQELEFDGPLKPLFIGWCHNHGINNLPNHRWTSCC